MRQRRSDERGTVAIVVALSLTMLLAFAALVVDVGLNWAARTQAQTAADSAALAGAALLPADPAGALTAVRDSLNANVGGLAGTGMVWASDGDETNGEVRCWTSPDPPPTGAAPCVGTGMTAIQVVTPPLLERYAFAGVLGRDSAEVKAAARAGVFSAGNVLPWGMLADDPIPSGGRICLRTDQPVSGVGSCPTSPSNAGYLRPLESARLHEVPCTEGSSSSAYRANVLGGIDHEVLPYTGGTGVNDVCTAGGIPDTMYVMDLGTSTSSSTSTALLGDLPDPDGRLRANPAELGAQVLVGLWDGDFLDPASVAPVPAGLPVTPGYSGDGFFTGGADFDTYQSCLGSLGAPGCQAIFDQRIASSARFVYLPVVRRTNGSSIWPNPVTSRRVRIEGFQAAFIEMPMDQAGVPALGPTGVETISLYLLPASMLPDQITGPQAGSLFYSGGVKSVHLTG
jgi:Putative Flp pilus-assembly TadE/G-like